MSTKRVSSEMFMLCKLKKKRKKTYFPENLHWLKISFRTFFLVDIPMESRNISLEIQVANLITIVFLSYFGYILHVWNCIFECRNIYFGKHYILIFTESIRFKLQTIKCVTIKMIETMKLKIVIATQFLVPAFPEKSIQRDCLRNRFFIPSFLIKNQFVIHTFRRK